MATQLFHPILGGLFMLSSAMSLSMDDDSTRVGNAWVSPNHLYRHSFRLRIEPPAIQEHHQLGANDVGLRSLVSLSSIFGQTMNDGCSRAESHSGIQPEGTGLRPEHVHIHVVGVKGGIGFDLTLQSLPYSSPPGPQSCSSESYSSGAGRLLRGK